jgi:hypothetical protein
MRKVQAPRIRLWRVTLAALTLLWLTVAAGAQNLDTDTTNGISVGDPKVFDNRSLSIMLDQLSAQLQSVQTIDASKLNAAVGNQQGAESHSKSLALSLAASAVPGAAAAADKANPQPPTPPGAATLPTAPTYTPSIGSNPSDLLTDQVDLSYQIFNIRTLLERALSDRLFNGKTRLQAVVGFQVSIDPPKGARDHAAFVEITINSKLSRQPPSLVAMMPYEKTYNSSAVSSSATAFAGAAIFQVFSVGVNAQKQDQVFYLFRDSDTLAMEQMQRPKYASDGSITFGWQFRPVLGSRSVSAGIRQMFVVIALPDTDENFKNADVDVQVRTYWRKYDHSLLATANKEDYVRGPYHKQFTVHSSESYESDLRPVVTDFQWAPTGENTAVVSFTGKNFFPGTQIQVGDQTHSGPASGLLIKSDISMELTTTLQDLAAGEAFISGRYGKGIVGPTESDCRVSGIAINEIKLTPLLGQSEQRLDIDLQEFSGRDLDFSRCTGIRPLVKFGDTLLPVAYRNAVTCGERNCVRLTTFLKGSLVTGNDLVAVYYPFRGPQWVSSLAFSKPVPMAIRYGKTSKAGPKSSKNPKKSAAPTPMTILRITGQPFNENWEVYLDKTYKVGTDALKLLNEDLLLTVPEATLEAYKQILLLRPPDVSQPRDQPRTIALDIPSAAPSPTKPGIDATKPPAPVVQGSAPSVVIAGTALASIKRVTFEGDDLPFQVSKDGTTLTVILSREVTRKPGNAVLILRPATGDFLPVTISVNQ